MKDSLNDLVLNHQLLAALYTNVLVNTADPQNTVPASGPSYPKLSFIGSNSRHITILVADDLHPFLGEEELASLTKMLQACNLNIGDTAIVNTANQPSWYEKLPQISPDKIIAFGVQPPGQSIDCFSVETINDRVWLAAPPLSGLITKTADSKQLKERLWSCLKEIFRLN